jgi:hypothetical protein
MRLETQSLHLFLRADEERHRRLGLSFMRLETQMLQIFLRTAGLPGMMKTNLPYSVQPGMMQTQPHFLGANEETNASLRSMI